MKRDLPKGVYAKHSAYYLVRQNKWIRLCDVSAGVPGVYRAIADLDQPVSDDRMPSVVASWRKEVSGQRSDKAQANDVYMCAKITTNFVEFRAAQVTPSVVKKFLAQFKTTPRTSNGYRTTLREIMRFAEESDMRPPGSNPVDSIKPIKLMARGRYITDSELRRIKVGAIYSDPHPTKGYKTRNRSGLMLCALIDLAYLIPNQQFNSTKSTAYPKFALDNLALQPRFYAGLRAGLRQAIRGFDSLHPLHLNARLHWHFPSERCGKPSTNGRGRGHVFTDFSHGDVTE